MITDFPEFESVNKLIELPTGRYIVVESFYRANAEFFVQATMSEIYSVAQNRIVGADIQILTEQGDLYFRDFYLTASGAWRNSYGATAWNLRDLLPGELLNYTLTSRRGTVVDHDGRGNLVRALEGAK